MNKHVRNGIALAAAGMAIGATIFSSSTNKRTSYLPVTSSAQSEVAKTQTANEYLRSFPNSFPEAREVRKYETPDAKYCLIHVRLPHLDLPGVSQEIESKKKGKPVDDVLFAMQKIQAAQVNQVQKEAYAVYTKLLQTQGFLPLWEEGMPVGLKLDRESIKGGHVRILRMLAEAGYIGRNDEALYEGHFLNNEPADAVQKNMFEEFRYMPGAAVLLAAEGKAQLIPSLEGRLVDKTILNDKKAFEAVGYARMDNAEDFVLKLAAQRAEPVKILSFGGLHAFGGKKSCGLDYSLEGRLSSVDNIDVWNSAHPAMKYSLIEITPTSYQEADVPTIRQGNKRLLPLK